MAQMSTTRNSRYQNRYRKASDSEGSHWLLKRLSHLLLRISFSNDSPYKFSGKSSIISLIWKSLSLVARFKSSSLFKSISIELRVLMRSVFSSTNFSIISHITCCPSSVSSQKSLSSAIVRNIRSSMGLSFLLLRVFLLYCSCLFLCLYSQQKRLLLSIVYHFSEDKK